MRPICLSSLCFGLVLVLYGCAVPLEKAIVGRFHGDADLSGLDKSMKAYEKQILTGIKEATIEIQEGGKATVNGNGQNFDATWKLEEKNLILTLSKLNETQRFEVSEGGNKFTAVSTKDHPIAAGLKVWFKKE